MALFILYTMVVILGIISPATFGTLSIYGTVCYVRDKNAESVLQLTLCYITGAQERQCCSYSDNYSGCSTCGTYSVRYQIYNGQIINSQIDEDKYPEITPVII